MADLLGFITIFLTCLFTMLVSYRWPSISKILFTALILRIFFLLLGHFLISLPDSTADAASFETIAWDLGKNGFADVMQNFKGPDPFFISWFIAIPYSIFGRSILMAKSISLIFGIGSILLAWLLTRKIWNENVANKAGWVMALFPSLILYSVLTMREVYICFFLLMALHGVVDWVKKNTLKPIFLAITGFLGATFFHGAMSVGAIAFIFIVGISSFKNFLKSIINTRINLKTVIYIFLFVISLNFLITNKISVPYLGGFDKITDVNRILEKTKFATSGDASWPKWTVASSPMELFYKAPIRSIYFVFSPFPWDVKKFEHFIGMFDAFLYLYLSYLIYLNRSVIWKDPALKTLFIILISYIFVFGIGVGNFGTSIRHRSKFVFMFILLAAPLLSKFIFYKKKSRIQEN